MESKNKKLSSSSSSSNRVCSNINSRGSTNNIVEHCLNSNNAIDFKEGNSEKNVKSTSHVPINNPTTTNQLFTSIAKTATMKLTAPMKGSKVEEETEGIGGEREEGASRGAGGGKGGNYSLLERGEKMYWTCDEDDLLRKLVHQYGAKDWSTLAQFFEDDKGNVIRRASQCRDRWVYHLQPRICKQSISTLEMERILELQSRFGNRWTKIATYIGGGRTGLQIRNACNAYWRRCKRTMARRSKMLSHNKNNNNNNNAQECQKSGFSINKSRHTMESACATTLSVSVSAKPTTTNKMLDIQWSKRIDTNGILRKPFKKRFGAHLIYDCPVSPIPFRALSYKRPRDTYRNVYINNDYTSSSSSSSSSSISSNSGADSSGGRTKILKEWTTAARNKQNTTFGYHKYLDRKSNTTALRISLKSGSRHRGRSSSSSNRHPSSSEKENNKKKIIRAYGLSENKALKKRNKNDNLDFISPSRPSSSSLSCTMEDDDDLDSVCVMDRNSSSSTTTKSNGCAGLTLLFDNLETLESSMS